MQRIDEWTLENKEEAIHYEELKELGNGIKNICDEVRLTN